MGYRAASLLNDLTRSIDEDCGRSINFISGTYNQSVNSIVHTIIRVYCLPELF